MTCNKQKITKHDRFDIFRSSLETVMSRILKNDNFTTSMVFLWEWRIKS